MSRAWILLGLIAGPASATCDIDDKQQILVTHGSVGHAPQQFRTGSYSGDAFRRGLEHALKTQESALAVKNEVMALLREAMRLSTDAAERAQIQAKLSKLDPLFPMRFWTNWPWALLPNRKWTQPTVRECVGCRTLRAL